MRKFLVLLVLSWAAIAGAAAAAESPAPEGAEAKPECRKAEINPVTGHVLCIDPLGAPVEAPPASATAPCKPDARAEGTWTWGPNCKQAPAGM